MFRIFKPFCLVPLCVTGRYKYLRHPSYVGWFYWSVGTQLLLCNPLCSMAYAWAGWNFFRQRIPYEEDILMRQYPTEYPSYMHRTFIGIPLIPSRKLPHITLERLASVQRQRPPIDLVTESKAHIQWMPNKFQNIAATLWEYLDSVNPILSAALDFVKLG